MANKQEIVDALNNIKNDNFTRLKKNVKDNCDEKNREALLQYSAILDNVTIGAHTKTPINYAGLDLNFRLLTAEEQIAIEKSIIEIQRTEGLFEQFYADYLRIVKILTKALTPSPFKEDGEEILQERDIKLLTLDVLEELYKRYMHFVSLAHKKVQDFTDEEIEDLVELVKKNPEVLISLDRSRLLIVSKYFLTYCVNLEKITKTEQTS